MKIIGLSGTNGSGKDTVAHLLAEKYGYLFANATAMLGDELTKRGLPHERANKADLSAEWRREFGMAAIVDRAVDMFKAGDYKGLVVGSLRHPGEADKVHELGGTMVWVDADPKIRYERISKSRRGRIEDEKSFDQFLAEEQREMQPVGDEATLNMRAVKEKSDVMITNDGNDMDVFRSHVVAVLKPFV